MSKTKSLKSKRNLYSASLGPSSKNSNLTPTHVGKQMIVERRQQDLRQVEVVLDDSKNISVLIGKVMNPALES